ncbi:hypothetical protein QBC40DRAFT_276621 [Triangularia verruculosa]|uniref:CENP-V/GFA domain-containing protein n=1 Tax=Triangularia verruculosa TaxID=2587418 RepID=A0AAN6XL51_9PEZI|nr:hypothetical protein QBC40DRAFT_276621 [Triangularia verruculosa]
MSTTVEPEGTLYKGSCHCGFAKYTVRLDFTKPPPSLHGANVTKCNCSICHKSGTLLTDPGDDGSSTFTLLTPPEKDLTMYTFNTGNIKWYFCPKCSIKLYCRVDGVFDGVHVRAFRVNVLTLDEKEDGSPLEELKDLKIKYWDFKEGDMPRAPLDAPGKGGMW